MSEDPQQVERDAATYTCYGCKVQVPYEKLWYECMCFDRKGVCEQCVRDKVPISIPPDHYLNPTRDHYVDEIIHTIRRIISSEQ